MLGGISNNIRRHRQRCWPAKFMMMCIFCLLIIQEIFGYLRAYVYLCRLIENNSKRL
jgi:hypothetical protein